MAAVLLFWYTHMAAVTSCENALFTFNQTSINIERGGGGGGPRRPGNRENAESVSTILQLLVGSCDKHLAYC